MTGNPIVEEKGEDFKKEVLIALMDNLTNYKKLMVMAGRQNSLQKLKLKKYKEKKKH